MNIYDCGDDVFKLNVFNLIADDLGLVGHLRVWWHRASGKYVIGMFGGFGGLTWYPELKISLSKPTKEQDEFLRPVIENRLKCACFYDGNSKKVSGHGKFLTEEMRKREESGEYVGSLKTWLVFDRFQPDKEEVDIDDAAKRMLV